MLAFLMKFILKIITLSLLAVNFVGCVTDGTAPTVTSTGGTTGGGSTPRPDKLLFSSNWIFSTAWRVDWAGTNHNHDGNPTFWGYYSDPGGMCRCSTNMLGTDTGGDLNVFNCSNWGGGSSDCTIWENLTVGSAYSNVAGVLHLITPGGGTFFGDFN